MGRHRQQHYLYSMSSKAAAIAAAVLLAVNFNNHIPHSALAFSLDGPGAISRRSLSPSIRSSSSSSSSITGRRYMSKTHLGAHVGVDVDVDVDYDNDNEVQNKNERGDDINRRKFLRENFVGTMSIASTSVAAAATSVPSVANAAETKTKKSRTDGYAVQHTEREWSYLLSGAQYNILRQGGTERQKSSILHTFTAKDHVGTYVCAGCNTPLFASDSKFPSGTGWPSFATALENNVEIEELDPIRAALDGREARCGTCGGHLGDLFNDGWIYPGTTAFQSGKRYCIDGAALIFKPINNNGGEGVEGGESGDVYGDMPPPNKVIRYESSTYRN